MTAAGRVNDARVLRDLSVIGTFRVELWQEPDGGYQLEVWREGRLVRGPRRSTEWANTVEVAADFASVLRDRVNAREP